MSNLAWWCSTCDAYYTPKTKKSTCKLCGSTSFLREWDEPEYEDPIPLDFDNDVYIDDEYVQGDD